MSGLFGSLGTASNSLRAFQRSLEATQNNVNNAGTPGFAKQRQQLDALPFEPAGGLGGGVRAGGVISARDQFSERAVWQQVTSLAKFTEQSSALEVLSNAIDVTGENGVPGALNGLFQSFSAWSVDPNSPAARLEVLNRAKAVTEHFQQTYDRLSRISADLDGQFREVAARINAVVSKLMALNGERLRSSQPDAGLDAQVHAALEELAKSVNFTAQYETDGTVTILLGGQIPLLIGDRQLEVRATFTIPSPPPPAIPNGRPTAALTTTDGQDVTPLVTDGFVAGLLVARNEVIPSLLGDSQQAGDLNRLAKQFADRVNGLLTGGWISQGPPPQNGIPLFSYSGADPGSIAATLTVNSSITSDTLAAIEPGPPLSANGIARRLAGISNSTIPADQLDGLTYLDFHSSMAAKIGHKVAQSHDGEDRHSQLLVQAHSMREQISGVSLDEEAAFLVQLQRSYQATAKLVGVVDELTQTIISMVN
jgi:flagellar hook-associated protein 1